MTRGAAVLEGAERLQPHPARRRARVAPPGLPALTPNLLRMVDLGQRGRVLAALQRAAGNASVTRALGLHGVAETRTVQRCGGEVHAGCPCAEEAGEQVQRQAASTVTVQRTPPYRPSPSWSTKGPAQGPFACVALPESLAAARWALWSWIFPAEAGSRCGCPIVSDVWRAYFEATGAPRFVWSEARDAGTCIITSLKNDDDHIPFEEPILARVRAAIPGLVPRLRGHTSITVPLADAGVTGALLAPPLNLNHNTRVGGSLFGGIGDSEYGPDTRRVDGTVDLDMRVDPGNRLWVQVQPRVVLHWHITDGVDFCPGNTGESAGFILQNAVTIVSQLEASGMARDIYVEADYTRVRFDAPQGPFPNPDLIGPIQPRQITVPARALFDFNSDRLRPDAEAELVRTLGTSPDHTDPSQPVQVRGHTDAKGSTGYNQGLSERRAAAVQRLLETRYPSLRGRVVARGFGETQPVAPNEVGGRDNPAGRQQNRRVEIELVEILPGP